jgi:hypothetical protein
MCEFVLRGTYLTTISYEKSKWNEVQSHKGHLMLGGNGSRNGVSLQIKRTLELSTFDVGTGFRVSKGTLRGLSGTAGLSFVRGEHSVATEFSDTLFDIMEKKEFRDNGIKIVPFAAVSYSYQFTPFLALGAQARFRHQKKSESFFHGFGLYSQARNLQSIDDDHFRYKFRGTEFHINLLYTLRIREVEG